MAYFVVRRTQFIYCFITSYLHIIVDTTKFETRDKLHKKTRLLGRPQPQMYPPVALNQYTLVNRTHKHYIYICFKAPQTS